MFHGDLKLDHSFDDLCRELEALGCVVRFSVFRYFGTNGASVDTHREVALRTLEQERDRINEGFKAFLERQQSIGRHRSDFFVLTVYEDLLGPGIAISTETFLGDRCDLVGRRLLLRGGTKNHLNHYFWSGDEEKFENVVKAEAEVGFSYAFLEPPYGLYHVVRGEVRSLPNADKHRLFFETVDQILGGLRESVIFRWSEDSSNFFDAGKEWWGTHFYTVFLPEYSRFVGIIASTTD